MKRIMLTCPFTGIPFEATKFEDGTILAYHPLTGKEMRMQPLHGEYGIPDNAWKFIRTYTLSECASKLNVTVQRVSNLVAIGTLPARTLPNGDKVVIEDDLKSYMRNRKNGRPRKEQE